MICGGECMDIVRIRAMKEWISQLPSGNITYKTISGKRYAYYQWTENGKQHGRRVKKHMRQQTARSPYALGGYSALGSALCLAAVRR